MQEHEKNWRPLSTDEVSSLFSNAAFPWWIAGGVALELALGQEIRSHSDIDILILRPDHLKVRKLLTRWDCWVADPPGTLCPWPVGKQLNSNVHDVWCRENPNDEWRFQLMIDETSSTNWVSRRDREIYASIQSITRTNTEGIRYLAPHVQLYYKAKRPCKKDEIDFKAVLESNVEFDKNWLRNSISQSYGKCHPWLEFMRD